MGWKLSPAAERVMLGLGLMLLVVFSSAVVWMYWGAGNTLTNGLVVLFAILSLVAVVQRWRGKIRLGFGLRSAAPLREFLIGFGICVFAWVGIFVLEWALGAIRVEGVYPEAGGLLTSLGTLTANAAFQEVMFRVLILCGLIALLRRPWLAVGLSACLFGLAHAASDGVTALGMASNALGGIMYGAAFVRTGRIWMPIGLHAAWNWAQGPLFGFAGNVTGDWGSSLIHQVAKGSDLITGGSYGEGSVVVIAFRFVVIALVVLATPPRGPGRSPYAPSDKGTWQNHKASTTETKDQGSPLVRRLGHNLSAPIVGRLIAFVRTLCRSLLQSGLAGVRGRRCGRPG